MTTLLDRSTSTGSPRTRVNQASRLLPGLAACAALALAAALLGRLAPVVGAPVIAIALGVLARLAVRSTGRLEHGVSVARSGVLQLAIVVLGAQVSLREVVDVGAGSLPVLLGTLVVCLALAYVLGRLLGIDSDLRTLIGVGTAVCGASAIAAVSPVIKAKSDQIAYAVSTIFVFNVLAVLAYPPLGHALGLSQHEFGLFAGTAVNDTSSVVAAASAYGHAAASHAAVVKLTRALMIIPICLGLAALVRRREARAGVAIDHDGRTGVLRLVPWFLVGFVLVAAANSLGLVPAATHPALSQVSLFLIAIALAGIGLSTDVARLRRTGARPLVLGLLLSLAVAGTSLALQLTT